ncbi:efflux RND transporter periplasmic adaptor subunit [Microbacterium sp. 18062]|uniref:efflux RND transporter periplasmic adaptor subunit n=1 Tax=Microbacterium sp. 18062 TaxID=2681410 RepID=UPI00135BA691|nr:biotin/lipoyl-binding protein [Microbacterium sp. 18062]
MVVWRRWVFPILLVVAFGLIAASLTKIAFFPDAQPVSAEPVAGIADPVVTVERGEVVNALSLSGTIARDEAFDVKSEIDGTVTAVHVGDGQSVEAGQVLFTVKQADPVRTIDIAAPEAGAVSEIAVVRGQAVSVGVALASLSPARHHVLSAVEPVQLYRLLGAPSEASVTIPGGPAPFACTGLDVQVAEDGTTSVRCAVPGDQTVFAGLPVTLDLTIGTVSDALVVPTTAVKGGAGSGVVWVDAGDGGDPEERTISLGVSDGTTVEVVDGLAEGEMIRQFVPGVAAPVEEVCYDDGAGGEYCETGMSW